MTSWNGSRTWDGGQTTQVENIKRQSLTYHGATPVLVDSEPDTWIIVPELLGKAILDRKEKIGKYPKAIVPVALYGMPYKIDCIDEAGIEARPVWKPMHKQPVYKDAPAYVNGVSEAVFKIGMCLPAGPYVSDEDVHYIVDCIKKAIV